MDKIFFKIQDLKLIFNIGQCVTPEMKPILQKYTQGKTRGSMFLTDDLQFEFNPYNVQTQPKKVKDELVVGLVKAQRMARQLKFTLSLDASMPLEDMIAEIHNQSITLAVALRNGGYQRLTGNITPLAAEEENEQAA